MTRCISQYPIVPFHVLSLSLLLLIIIYNALKTVGTNTFIANCPKCFTSLASLFVRKDSIARSRWA